MEIRHTEDPVLLGLHLIIILTGLVDCFYGYKAFQYALAILLGLAGAGAAAYFAYDLGGHSWTYSVIGLVVGGGLGAVLATFCFKAGVFAVGALAGYSLLAPWLGERELWIQMLVLVIGCGICGLLALVVAKLAIMAATATTGAFRIVYGGWYLFAGGPAIIGLGSDPEAGWHLLAAKQDPFTAMLVLAGIGFCVQFFRERKQARAKEA